MGAKRLGGNGIAGETSRVLGSKRLGWRIEAKRLGGKRLGGKRLGGKTSCDRSEWYRVFLSRMCTQGPPMLSLFVFGH